MSTDRTSARLEIFPCTLREANAFVLRYHRHHRPNKFQRFSLAVRPIGGSIVGVAIVGNPKARRLQDGRTAEVTRLATDGTKNACSALYSAAWRACRAMGYQRLVTYILDTESGGSLKAAGWMLIGKAGGGKWSNEGRPRLDDHPTQGKLRFEVVA